MAAVIFLFLGLLCLAYFAGIGRYTQWSSKFPVIWAVLGVLLFFLGILFLTDRLSERAEMLCIAGGLVLLAGILAVTAVIISAKFLTVEPDLDYLVVLGAQVKGTRPSLSLQYRIHSACQYLRENPGTKAVLSGGKGPDEGISEARCMYEGMVCQGIEREQLILEDRSSSTCENIEFTRRLLQEKAERDGEDAVLEISLKVGIVTSDFHLFRGMAIARKKTPWKVYGISAKSSPFLLPNYLFREFFCVIKDRLAGNL